MNHTLALIPCAKRLAAVSLLLLIGSAFGQTTDVLITDSNGNQTTGKVDHGNLYFHDGNGNSAYGTIRDGKIYLTTDKGETTFGTVRDGNVFLTDPKGNTTGTIRNGYIFLNNSNGSTTSGTYDGSGNMHISTTPSPSDLQRQQEQQQQEEKRQQQQQLENEARQKAIQQQNYEAGAAVGQAIGDAIAAGIENHRINSYCKANSTGTVHLTNGLDIPCPNSPMDSWEQQQIDSYCADNPGSWMEIGKHHVNCYTAPDPPTLKWAIWELKQWRWDYTHQRDKVVIAGARSSDELRADWESWRETYCRLAPSGSTYQDLNGKKQHCN